MKNLFHDLRALGFDNVDDLPAFNTKSPIVNFKPAEKDITPEDCLFQKSFNCPVCDNNFKEQTVKTSKARFLGTDTDLMPSFTPIYPFFYGVVMCPSCGYTALSENFLKITDTQCNIIKKNIAPKFKYKNYKPPFNEKDAIERYKLALLNSMVKKGRTGEQGYICLVISWLYKLSSDDKNRQIFLTNAYHSFTQAYEKDTFPIHGMDQYVTAYLLAELARLIGCYSESSKWASIVLTSRSATAKTKDLALDLKNKLREETEIDKHNKT